jgi:hypothetical protein
VGTDLRREGGADPDVKYLAERRWSGQLKRAIPEAAPVERGDA